MADHQLIVRAAAPLAEGRYYVRSVQLRENDSGGFTAVANLVPRPGPAGKDGRGEETSILTNIHYLGMAQMLVSLSALNLLNLQGRCIQVKRDPEMRPDVAYIVAIEALIGDEFRRALQEDYGPRPRSRTPKSAH